MTSRLLTMPRLGETMESGRLSAWLKRPGEAFRRGEALLEVETDKAVAEVPALGDGTLSETLAEAGQEIAVGAPLARIDAVEETGWEPLPAGNHGEPPAPAVADGPTASPAPEADLLMPRLGETMESGRIAAWLVQPGFRFRRGDALVEIETDKTVAELPADQDGEIVAILAAEGSEAAVGAPIARIRARSGGSPAGAPATQAAAAPAGNDVQVPRPAQGQPAGTGTVRPRATPLARRLARLSGVDLASLRGTGRRGRVEARDVPGVPAVAPTAASATGRLALPSGHLVYAVHGAPGSRAIILLHGFGGDRTVWAGLANRLGRAGLFVLSVDLPGHGETTIEAGAVADLSAPLPALLDHVGVAAGDLEIVGHSAGAAAAVALAETLTSMGQAPRRVTLIGPVGLGSEIDAGFVEAMGAGPTPGGLAHLLRRVTSDGSLRMGAEALEATARTLSAGRLRELAGALAGEHGQRIDLLARIDRLCSAVPTRVVFGVGDRIVPWTQVAALPAAVAVHLLARSGHMPHWDQPDELARLLC